MMANAKSDKPVSKSAKSKTIIDVSHADDSAPSPNSKSVIIPSRPILKDPMVVNEDKDNKEEAELKNPPAKEKAVEPPAEPQPKKASESKPKSKPEPEPTAPADADAEPNADDKSAPNEKLEAEAAEQARHESAVGKLAESKKYHLPINSVEKRRSRRFVALGILLSLLLVVAWADIALDAGLIQLNNVKPLTHFFSN